MLDLAPYQAPQERGMNAIPQLPPVDMPKPDVADTLAGEFNMAMSEIDMADYSAGISPHHANLFESMAASVKPKMDIDQVAQAAKQGIPPQEFASVKRYEAFAQAAPVKIQEILQRHEAEVSKLSETEFQALQARLTELTAPKAPEMQQYRPQWQEALGAVLATAFGGTQAGNTAAGAIMEQGQEAQQIAFANKVQVYKQQIEANAQAIELAKDRYRIAVESGSKVSQARANAEIRQLEKEQDGLLKIAEEEMQQAGQTQRTMLTQEGRITVEDMKAASRSALQEAGFDFKKPLQDAQIRDKDAGTKKKEAETKTIDALRPWKVKDAEAGVVLKGAQTWLAKQRASAVASKTFMDGEKLELDRAKFNEKLSAAADKANRGDKVSGLTVSQAFRMAESLDRQAKDYRANAGKENMSPEMRQMFLKQADFAAQKAAATYKVAEKLSGFVMPVQPTLPGPEGGKQGAFIGAPVGMGIPKGWNPNKRPK